MNANRHAAAVVAVALAFCSTAGLAQQCLAPMPNPPAGLSPDQMKAVVVNADVNAAVLNGGNFSLVRTLDNIIKTSRGDMATPVTASEREQLLTTLLQTFGETSLSNPTSGLTFVASPRSREAALTASDLLDPTSANGMKPVGLFNRLDLAPSSLSNCGEYRIVYAKNNAGSTDFRNRFFLIFEAALPNPNVTDPKAGCRSVAKLWDSLSLATDAEIATKLESFYYAGGALEPGGPVFEPVIDFRHFGLPDGQVRANAFMPDPGQNWHLLQWQVELDSSGQAFFVHAPINENPVPALFGGALPSATPPSVFDQLKLDFQSDFAGQNVWQLISVDQSAIQPGATPPSEGDLINRLGVDIDDEYYAVESDVDLPDDPTPRAIGTPLEASIQQTLAASQTDQICGVTPTQVLNRMGAMTCAGCHQLSNGKEIATGVSWPRSLGFVQINERGGLSELLIEHFLPARYAIVQAALKSAPTDSKIGEANTYSDRRKMLNELLDTYNGKENSIFSDAMSNLAMIKLLSIELRADTLKEPGAFVQFRKPD